MEKICSSEILVDLTELHGVATQKIILLEANVCLCVNAVHVQEGPLVRYVSLQMTHVENLFNSLEEIFPVSFSRREKSSEIR
jgi:hypothetical protein